MMKHRWKRLTCVLVLLCLLVPYGALRAADTPIKETAIYETSTQIEEGKAIITLTQINGEVTVTQVQYPDGTIESEPKEVLTYAVEEDGTYEWQITYYENADTNRQSYQTSVQTEVTGIEDQENTQGSDEIVPLSQGEKREVSSEAELREAIAQANELGAQAAASGVEMEPMTIELTADVYFDTINSNNIFQFTTDTRVIIEGNGYKIAPSQQFITKATNKKIYWIFEINGASVTLNHVVLDGTGSGPFSLLAAYMQLGKKSTGTAPQLTINEGTEIQNLQYGSMGGITNYNGLVVMNGGSIHDNLCTENSLDVGSGAIFTIGTKQSSKFIMNGGEIYNNVNQNMGGAVSTGRAKTNYQNVYIINDGKIHHNKAHGGGAVFCANSILTMNGGEIYENEATVDVLPNTSYDAGEGGGAITLQSNSTGDINGGKIYNNYSDLSGGAFQVSANSSLTINNAEIYNNEAESHGGAICVADAYSQDQATKSVLTINNAVLHDNIARSTFSEDGQSSSPHAPGGGAIYAHEFCEVYLKEGAQLYRNQTQSNGHGGAIYICFGGLLQMDGGVISDNLSAANGGAVYLEGADSYSGVIHGSMPDDGYAEGSLMRFNDGLIANNHAMANGGAIYAEGDNMVEDVEYRGGACLMNGGVITANQADKQGGGVYLEGKETGQRSSSFHMTDGALYFNIAGKDGNSSGGADMAGAELYSEGGNTHFSVVSAQSISEYLHDESHRYVPDKDREVWFSAWYDDYSDEDEEYGKKAEAIGSGTHSGRYMSSQVIDRKSYEPQANSDAYKALILDRTTALEIEKSVSGEGMDEEAEYTFEITMDVAKQGGKKYPITYEGEVKQEGIGTLKDGSSYLVVEEGKAIIRMKAGEKVLIEGLPAGCKIEAEEIGSEGAKETRIEVEGAEEEAKIEEASRKAETATISRWENAKESTKVRIHYENIYEKEEPIKEEEEKKEEIIKEENPKEEKETQTGAMTGTSLFLMTALLSMGIAGVLAYQKRISSK